MDLNASPLPEDEEEYFESHLEEHVAHHDNNMETSVQTLRREREERRERLKSNQVDDRPMRITRPLELDEVPQLKKLKYDRFKLPPGWLDCPKFGQEISFIVPSKVPLGEAFHDLITPGKRYSFKQVFHHLKVKGIKLGMVVDLTNTDRYYSPIEFKKEGLKYLKIRCQGRDSVPDNESVNTFVFEVAQYIFSQNDRQPKKYVFVHCTHGHNRTGYMIVHYLMRTQQASSVTEAIQRFADARPPGIYKPDYIDALYAFYHETKTDILVCPSTPEWKRSSDFDLNGEAVPEDDDGLPYTSTNEKVENVAKLTIDDVLGDKIPDAQEFQLQRFCYDILNQGPPARGRTQFPGSHPVSLDRDNLQLLRQRYYYATWKADGTRYMLLLSPDGCYLIDRSFKFRRVQMRFPCKNMSEFHQFTLLDGEMVIDTVSPQKQERRYLIYDLIAINRVSVVELAKVRLMPEGVLFYGQKRIYAYEVSNQYVRENIFFSILPNIRGVNKLKQRPFYERWKMIEKEVVEPRNADRRAMDSHPKPPYRYDLEPFRVRRKDFWLLSTVGKVLKEFIPKLSHEADGLIFQGWDDPYVARTHAGLLKWKYPEMNSVDFLFEVGEDGVEHLYLHERGKKRLMEGNRVTFGDGADPSAYSGKIVECSFDVEENIWTCMRIRPDKNTPNEFNTYKKVMRSIKDNITEEVLLNEISEIIRLPMYADRIRQDSRAQKKGKPPMTGKEIR